MGSINDRNAMDLTEVKNIKKRWQKYMEELYKTDLHDPDNHNDMILSKAHLTSHSKMSGSRLVIISL